MGVFPPFRGGISNFYQTLYEKLSYDHDVTAINFSLQYPSILFPGKSQYDNNLKSDIKIERTISSINPISWYKTAKRIIKLKPDIIIFKYWMPFFALSFGSIIRLVEKKIEIKSLVICDNIIPHESRFFDNKLTKYFFKYIDYFIVMSKSVENDLLSLFPDAKYIYTPHPLYDIFGKSINKEESKSHLKINESKLILFFGLIRPYKGLVDEYKIKNIIDLRFEFVPNNKVSLYFSAADIIVLPYKSATQSGIVPVAYHFNKPVIVTNVGGLGEIVQEGKTGYVVTPNSVEISNSIIKYYRNSDKINFKEKIKVYNKNFSWDKFVETIQSIVVK